jgi:hypothetical protein
MFDMLDRYKNNGHFFFGPTDWLEELCNAPDDRVYLTTYSKVMYMEDPE